MPGSMIAGIFGMNLRFTGFGNAYGPHDDWRFLLTVGGIVLAVFLPIFKLQEKLSGG